MQFLTHTGAISSTHWPHVASSYSLPSTALEPQDILLCSVGLKFFLEVGFKFFKKHSQLPGSPAICGEIVEIDKELKFWLETEDTSEESLFGMVPGWDCLCGPKT